MSKLMKLDPLNMYSLLYVCYNSMKLFKKIHFFKSFNTICKDKAYEAMGPLPSFTLAATQHSSYYNNKLLLPHIKLFLIFVPLLIFPLPRTHFPEFLAV